MADNGIFVVQFCTRIIGKENYVAEKMKTHLLVIIVSVIIISSIIFALSFEYSFENEYYEIKIQGMKEKYVVGDEYSFYYTLSGYGNTCGAWIASYPDKYGVIQHRGAVVDCTAIINRNLSYDSRADNRMFTSFVPEIEGKYNVTVSLENTKPKIYGFTVLPKKADYPITEDNYTESKVLECYSLFHCNSTKQNFEECINSYQHGFTVKSMCQFSNVTVEGGCVNIKFADGTGMISCD